MVRDPWHSPCNPLVGDAVQDRTADMPMTLGVTMWRRSIPISSLAAYAADPEAFCRSASAPGRGRMRVLALGVLGLVAVAGALALTGRLPPAVLPVDGLLDALTTLVPGS